MAQISKILFVWVRTPKWEYIWRCYISQKKLFLWFLFPLILSFKETTIFYDFLKQVRWLPWYLFRRGVSVLGSHGVLKLLFVRTKRSFLFLWIIHSLSLFKSEVRKKNLLKKINWICVTWSGRMRLCGAHRLIWISKKSFIFRTFI